MGRTEGKDFGREVLPSEFEINTRYLIEKTSKCVDLEFEEKEGARDLSLGILYRWYLRTSKI